MTFHYHIGKQLRYLSITFFTALILSRCLICSNSLWFKSFAEILTKVEQVLGSGQNSPLVADLVSRVYVLCISVTMSIFTPNFIYFHVSKSVCLIASWFTEYQPQRLSILATETLSDSLSFRMVLMTLFLSTWSSVIAFL